MANVKVIPAISHALSAQSSMRAAKRRVAAYARVSTGSEEQLTSYEAQVDYYTKFIQGRADWQFVSVYTDEGISAVTTKKRDGFNKMISDALGGSIDLIVTKSVSRFARNTVDSLMTVRKLKEKGVEVWFEKENIYTLDSKGELLITIMSSLAQEESRSISENVTWGQRKRMADGKITLPYAQFLGYVKGEDGLPRIVPKEAKTVRLIYRLFMEGKTYSAIAKHLVERGVPTPAGKSQWQTRVVQSILQNEKYKGHALMQKTYCADFLTKRMVKNTGQVQQYYVEDSHPAVIDPEEWDAVQTEIERRKSLKSIGRCTSPFAGKLICGACGGFYGRKVWGSYKDDKSYRREVYRCNDKYADKSQTGGKCLTPAISEEDIKTRFLVAFSLLMKNRDGVIEDCQLAQAALSDTTALDTELNTLRQESEVVVELIRKAIQQNARTAQNQANFMETHDGYLARYHEATRKIKELEAARQERLAKGKNIQRFIADIHRRPLLLDAWDESLWLAVIDNVTIHPDGGMSFMFKDGRTIQV